MNTKKFDALDWAGEFLWFGDGPVDPERLTHKELKEFVWWICKPENYEFFRNAVCWDLQVGAIYQNPEIGEALIELLPKDIREKVERLRKKA